MYMPSCSPACTQLTFAVSVPAPLTVTTKSRPAPTRKASFGKLVVRSPPPDPLEVELLPPPPPPAANAAPPPTATAAPTRSRVFEPPPFLGATTGGGVACTAGAVGVPVFI